MPSEMFGRGRGPDPTVVPVSDPGAPPGPKTPGTPAGDDLFAAARPAPDRAAITGARPAPDPDGPDETAGVLARQAWDRVVQVGLGWMLVFAGVVLALSAAGVWAAAERARTEADAPLVSAQPDAVILLPPDTPAGTVTALRDDLLTLPGVSFAASATAEPPGPSVLVGIDTSDATTGRTVEGVLSIAEEQIPGSAVVGRAVSDRDLATRVWWGVATGLGLAALAAGVAVSILVGWIRGALTALVLTAPPWLGGMLGRQAAGPFDGSLTASAVPGTLAGVLVAGFAMWRLLEWFEDPEGDDQADMIRRSVVTVGRPVLQVLLGLAAGAVTTELLLPTRSAVTVMLVGAGVSALLTFAVVPAALASLVDGAAQGIRPQRPEPMLVVSLLGRDATMTPPVGPFLTPTGRGLSPRVAPVVLGVLLLLGLFSLEVPSPSGLLDRSSWRNPGAAAPALAAGAVTDAVVIRAPGPMSDADGEAWSNTLSGLAGSAWVDGPWGRWASGSRVEADPSGLGLAPADPDRPVVLVVPADSGRSAPAQALAAQVGRWSPTGSEITGEPVEAGRVAVDNSRALIALLAILVAAGAAVAINTTASAPTVAASSLVRLLTMAGVTGFYQLVTGGPTAPEPLIVAALAWLGVGLFEAVYLEQVVARHRVENTEHVLASAAVRPGAAAVAGLLAAALAALALPASGLATVARFGLLAALSAVVVVAVLWLGEPTVIGDRLVEDLARRPVRRVVASLGVVDDEAEYRARVEAVTRLLTAESMSRAEPDEIDLTRVYLPGTAAFHEAADRQHRLSAGGLTMHGDAPRIASVVPVSDGPPVALAVTVEEPQRELVGDSGAVLGIRRAERRSLLVWLGPGADGALRIVDAVEVATSPHGVPPSGSAGDRAGPQTPAVPRPAPPTNPAPAPGPAAAPPPGPAVVPGSAPIGASGTAPVVPASTVPAGADPAAVTAPVWSASLTGPAPVPMVPGSHGPAPTPPPPPDGSAPPRHGPRA
ncbi:MAG: hypothetical protein ACK5PP_14110 [Acidimicrobiales bacterium]